MITNHENQFFNDVLLFVFRNKILTRISGLACAASFLLLVDCVVWSVKFSKTPISWGVLFVIFSAILISGIFLSVIPVQNLLDDQDNENVVTRTRLLTICIFMALFTSVLVSCGYAISLMNVEQTKQGWIDWILGRKQIQETNTWTPVAIILSSCFAAFGFVMFFFSRLITPPKDMDDILGL